MCTVIASSPIFKSSTPHTTWHFLLLIIPCVCVCVRVTEEDFEKLPASTVPEMQRTNLAPVILQLKALGIDNVLRCSFLSVSDV